MKKNNNLLIIIVLILALAIVVAGIGFSVSKTVKTSDKVEQTDKNDNGSNKLI